jgi:hypothetical protein
MTDWTRLGFSDPEAALRSKSDYFKRHSLEQLSLVRDLRLSPSLSLSSTVFVCVQLVNHGFPDALQYIERFQKILEKPNINLILKKLITRHEAIQKLKLRRELFSNTVLMTSLYSDEKYTLIRSPNDSRDLMIVFSTLYNNFGVSNSVMVSLLQQAGFSVLLLRDRSRYRYLRGLDGGNSDIEAVAKFVIRIKEKEKFKRLFVTGFSSGGYGSLFLSTLLNVESYVGFSIESDFSAGGPPGRIAQQPHKFSSAISAKYLVSLAQKVKELNDGIPRLFYYGSRSGLDRAQATCFEGVPGCLVECVQDAGHETPLDLLENEKLLSVFESAKNRFANNKNSII